MVICYNVLVCVESSLCTAKIMNLKKFIESA